MKCEQIGEGENFNLTHAWWELLQYVMEECKVIGRRV